MANITQYENPITGLQPDERGIDANLQSARRAGAFFNQAAQATETVGNQVARNIGSTIRDAGNAAVDYAQHQEISHGAAAYAGLNDQLTQAWNQTAKTADPNDPTVAQKFREETLEPALEKFGQGFLTEGGQKWAETRVDSLRNHMFEKTAADMGTLAGDAVSVNVKTMANSMSNTAMSDPSSVPHLLDSIDSSVGAMVDSSPNIKGVVAQGAKIKLTETMREAIVKAGAIGAIQKSADPEAEAEKWGARYPEYINGAELKQLGSAARQQMRADRIDRAYSDHIDKQEIQDRSDSTETGIMSKLYSDDPKQQSQVSARDIANIPDNQLNRQGKERLIGIVNRELKPETEARVSARTSAQIFSEMRKDDADPQKIRQMLFDARTKEPGEPGSLNKSDFNDLQKNLIDLKTPEGQERGSERGEFMKRFAATIDPSMGDTSNLSYGHHTALGETKMYEAEKALRVREQQLGPDWRKLYDPSSSEYFGKPANLMRYQASMQGAADYQANLGGKNLTGPGKTDAGTEVKDLPPMAGARKGWDGGWYVETAPGKYSRVKP
jgi:hypothetical protein